MEKPYPPTENLNHQPSSTNWRLMFFFICCALVILLVPISLAIPKPVDRLIHIDATSFQFTPSEVMVNPGDRVTIEFVSNDVVHGISIDEYDFVLISDPGQTATGIFIATKTGMFRFRCSVPCGNLHPFMIGKLQVGTNLLLIRGLLLAFLSVIAAGFSMRKFLEITKAETRKIL